MASGGARHRAMIPARRQPLVVARNRQHERDLHHLRRLEAALAPPDPALGAAALDAEEDHRREHEKRDDVERIGRAHPHPDIGQRDDEEERKADAVADHVAAGPGFERTARHGIERGDPDQRDGGDEGEERPVEQRAASASA